MNKGTVVIITFLILITLMILGCYFLTFILAESRISKNQEAGARTYYLAEAGINEAIWKLKNDWEQNFITCVNGVDCSDPACVNWSNNFSRTFSDGSEYHVTIQNSACGRGEIISTSTLPLPNEKFARREVKTTVFKALDSPTHDAAFFTGGSSELIKINADSKVKIEKGNLFCGSGLTIDGESVVEIYDDPITTDSEGQALAVGNLNVKSGSTLDVCEVKCAANACDPCLGKTGSCEKCPPDDVSISLVDFESDYPECNPPGYSFKCRAQTAETALDCRVEGYDISGSPIVPDTRCIYSASEFEDLLEQAGEEGTLTLNPGNLPNIIFYIESGTVELKQGCHLIVNGVLVVNDNIKIGKKGLGGQITINQPDNKSPSGLLVKGDIDIGSFSALAFLSQPVDITGVIYSSGKVDMRSVPEDFNILGGVIARKLELNSTPAGSDQWLTITLDNDIILYGLGYIIDEIEIDPVFSPIIIVDHWEESY